MLDYKIPDQRCQPRVHFLCGGVASQPVAKAGVALLAWQWAGGAERFQQLQKLPGDSQTAWLGFMGPQPPVSGHTLDRRALV